ncbi:MAG: hypothetical protein KDD44_05950, partial [Bdellovibrionales bacterium]|nr:hypothetical protein [Bdellovibrionales bacterium]
MQLREQYSSSSLDAPLDEPSLGLTTGLRSSVRLPWVALLLITLITIAVAPTLGWYLEDAQTLGFPLVLLSLWKAFPGLTATLPRAIVILPVIAWMGSALHVRAFVSLSPTGQKFYLG